MSLPVYYYVFGTPLGILGLIRWGCWLVRRIPAVLYRPMTGGHRMSMSIVVPVYQEDPVVFAAAIESWLANRVEEVILVIDVSDTTCQEIAAGYPVTVLITDVPGKRDALRRGWNAASTELVALVDSDTVWAADVADEVCRPFADPRIGGVGTRQNVYGSKGFLARITDMFLDHRYFDENASQSLLGRAVSCLSGRTAVYRRRLLMDIEAEFMHETFWGVPCLSGDDKRLTTLVLERGYLTYMQRSAEVWSTFPDTWRVFFKQRLRWARNTWRSDLRALSRRWVWRKPFLAYTMIDKGVSSFTLLVGPAFMIYSIVVQNWVFCGVLAAWWWISRSAKLLPHLRRRPSSFLFVPGYVVVSWLMALIKLQALLTIRKQRWLTRQVAVENGQVVRTAADPDAAAGMPVPAAVPAVPVAAAVPAPVPTAPVPAAVGANGLPPGVPDDGFVPAFPEEVYPVGAELGAELGAGVEATTPVRAAGRPGPRPAGHPGPAAVPARPVPGPRVPVGRPVPAYDGGPPPRRPVPGPRPAGLPADGVPGSRSGGPAADGVPGPRPAGLPADGVPGPGPSGVPAAAHGGPRPHPAPGGAARRSAPDPEPAPPRRPRATASAMLPAVFRGAPAAGGRPQRPAPGPRPPAGTPRTGDIPVQRGVPDGPAPRTGAVPRPGPARSDGGPPAGLPDGPATPYPGGPPAVPYEGGPAVPYDGGPAVPYEGGPAVPYEGGPAVPYEGGPAVPYEGGPAVPYDGGPAVPYDGGPPSVPPWPDAVPVPAPRTPTGSLPGISPAVRPPGHAAGGPPERGTPDPRPVPHPRDLPPRPGPTREVSA